MYNTHTERRVDLPDYFMCFISEVMEKAPQSGFGLGGKSLWLECLLRWGN